jgi:diguanylate cyclase (GGDEF)-like protein
MHPLSLRFLNPDLERDYQAASTALELRQFRLAFGLAAFMYASFGLLDASIIPEVASTAWFIRFGVVVPIALFGLMVTFQPGLTSWLRPILAVLSVTAGLGIVIMIALASPPGSYLYYAGLVLCSAYIYTFTTLKILHASLISWGVGAAYELTALIGTTSTLILINNTFFLVGINIIGMAACYWLERSRRSDFLDKRTIREQAQRLNEALQATEELARRDPLTGLFNRRHFLQAAAAELERSGRLGLHASMAMLDIDHFKSVNDQFGHVAGDRVLCVSAQAIHDALRAWDLVCRFGGEEFLVLLPETSADDAARATERLRARIAEATQHDPECPCPVTASVGVSEWRRDQADTLEAVIDRADAALYQAKAHGRDQVVLM